MGLRSQKYWLEPERIDAAVDKAEGTPAAASITTAVAQITQLVAALPTSNPGPNILWNDAGVIKKGT
jgi:hypothetical protein